MILTPCPRCAELLDAAAADVGMTVTLPATFDPCMGMAEMPLCPTCDTRAAELIDVAGNVESYLEQLIYDPPAGVLCALCSHRREHYADTRGRFAYVALVERFIYGITAVVTWEVLS